MKKTARKIAAPFFKRYYKWFHRKERIYSYKNITAVVVPGVFSPYFTTSTRILLDFLSEKELSGKTFLELGCGCGIISLLAAEKGALVTASDISEKALSSLAVSAGKTNKKIETLYSDLFDNIPEKKFNIIVINPPYYPRNPRNETEKAWYCGEQFEYFEKLFRSLPGRIYPGCEIFMILSEDCDIIRIKNTAQKNNLELIQVREIKKWNETNFIFFIRYDYEKKLEI